MKRKLVLQYPYYHMDIVSIKARNVLIYGVFLP